MQTLNRADPVVDLESVIKTAELNQRSCRQRDADAENRALVRLAEALASSPKDILQRLVETALELCKAGSAGINLIEEENGEKIFRWHALTGALASHLRTTTPRNFSPCGTVVDRNATQLFCGLDRHFTYFADVKPRIIEALHIPFGVGGRTVGTIWVATHDDHRQFDAEDERLIANLGKFAGAAFQVRSSLEVVQEADRRKDEFLVMLAHELRNPIAPIHHAVQVLNQEILPPSDAKRSREIMGRQLRNLTRLIDDLLDMSRVRLGKVVLRKERFELTTVVKNALEIAFPLIDSFRHDFVLDLLDDPLWVEADPGRLTQIIANLVINAAKYTNEGGHIKLVIQQEEKDVVIRVQDDGIGISAEMLPKIFDLFTQVDTAQQRARGGLGIGLSLVKNLVEMHNGTVAVRSAGGGNGSEFVVRLPIGTHGPGFSEAMQVSEQLSSSHLRILIVDDNVDSAESLAILLRLDGHEIRTAYDGPSALNVATEFAPEVVLQDIGLPGMNGYEVARRLRQHPTTARSLLVALSGYGQADDLRRCHVAGFDHHLLKPVDFDDLANLFASLMPEASCQRPRRVRAEIV